MGHVRILATAMIVLATTIYAHADEQIQSSEPNAAEHAASGASFVRCVGHERNVYSVVLTPDGKFAVSGGEDPYLIVWNTEDGSEVRRILRRGPDQKDGGARDLELSADGTKVGALAPGQRVQFWDIATGEPDKESYPLDAPTIHWALSNDRTKLARSAFSDVSVTDLKQNKVIWTKQFPPEEVGLVHSVAFSPDGQLLAVALSFDGRGRLVKSKIGKVQVWNVASDEEAFSTWPLVTGVYDAVFSPDGKQFVAGSFTLEAWALPKFTSLFQLPSIKIRARYFICLAFSPSGKLIAAGDNNGRVHLWDAANGALVSSTEAQQSEVRAINFSGDGSKLAAVVDGKSIIIWSLPLTGP